MKNVFRRISALLMVVILCASMGASAAAANVCSVVRGSSDSAVTFTVSTKNRWWILPQKVTFSQSKGVLNCRNWTGYPKNHSAYDSFKVTYQKVGSSQQETATLKNGRLTIKLDANSTYRITVTPANVSTLQARYVKWGAVNDWTRDASWWIKSTKGITLCK